VSSRKGVARTPRTPVVGKLSPHHERILLAARIVAAALRTFRAADVFPLLAERGIRPRMSGVAQSLRFLSTRSYLRQVGPGQFAKLEDPLPPKPPVPIAGSPLTFQGPSREQLMAGSSRPRRQKQVALEEPLWPEDAPK